MSLSIDIADDERDRIDTVRISYRDAVTKSCIKSHCDHSNSVTHILPQGREQGPEACYCSALSFINGSESLNSQTEENCPNHPERECPARVTEATCQERPLPGETPRLHNTYFTESAMSPRSITIVVPTPVRVFPSKEEGGCCILID
eukprot:g49674.t1